jgi:hypothetical protein
VLHPQHEAMLAAVIEEGQVRRTQPVIHPRSSLTLSPPRASPEGAEN